MLVVVVVDITLPIRVVLEVLAAVAMALVEVTSTSAQPVEPTECSCSPQHPCKTLCVSLCPALRSLRSVFLCFSVSPCSFFRARGRALRRGGALAGEQAEEQRPNGHEEKYRGRLAVDEHVRVSDFFRSRSGFVLLEDCRFAPQDFSSEDGASEPFPYVVVNTHHVLGVSEPSKAD